MKIVESFPKLTHVVIVDDDTGYYIQDTENNERLDIRFNTPIEVVKHANSEYLVFTFESIEPD